MCFVCFERRQTRAFIQVLLSLKHIFDSSSVLPKPDMECCCEISIVPKTKQILVLIISIVWLNESSTHRDTNFVSFCRASHFCLGWVLMYNIDFLVSLEMRCLSKKPIFFIYLSQMRVLEEHIIHYFGWFIILG